MKTVKLIRTDELKSGDVIMVKTGCKYFNNIQTSPQRVIGVCGREVSFKSGLVCFFNAATLHKLA